MTPASAAIQRRRDAAFARGLCLCGEKLVPERKACRGCLDDARERIARRRGSDPVRVVRERGTPVAWLAWATGGAA